MKFCAIILNRNLPQITDRLYNKLKKQNKKLDIFVLESGSDKKNVSKNFTWHANSPQIKKKDLDITEA